MRCPLLTSLLVLPALLAPSACAPASPVPSASAAPSSPAVDADSIQPALDAALVDMLGDRFTSVATVEGDRPGSCTTTIQSASASATVSAADVAEVVHHLQVVAAYEPCVLTLHAIGADGTAIDLGHLAAYLPVEALDSGDVLVTPIAR